jgi:MFS family permease
MFGVVISALLFGYLSDQYGRIRVLYAGIALEIFGGLCSTYSPNVTCFAVSRLVLSIGCYGRNLTAFLIGIECVGPKYRAKIGIGYQLGWAFGYMLLPGLAYLCRDHELLFLCTTLPELLWLGWLWRIPESPKWLISHGRYNQAEEVLRDALKYNGKSAAQLKEHIEALRDQIERERLDRACKREINFFDLWRNVNIRNFTLILYFTW